MSTTLVLEQNEQNDTRAAILNSFLKTPHGKYEQIASIHKEILEKDPELYAHLAAWYDTNGKVRDHANMFIAGLLNHTDGEYQEFREAGWALMQKRYPHQVLKVREAANSLGGRWTKAAMRAVKDYLNNLQYGDKGLYEREILKNRKALITLFKMTRLKRTEFTDRVLFSNNPPENSLIATVKAISKEPNPDVQARMIVENNIPYDVAKGLVKAVTPAVMAAFVAVMTDQELFSNLASLETRGLSKIKELDSEVKARIKKMGNKSSGKVAIGRAKKAVESGKISEDLAKMTEEMADKRLKAMSKINMDVAMFVDKSGSMDVGIEFARIVASTLGAIVSGELHIYAVDTVARKLNSNNRSWAAMQKVFGAVKADGGTALGAGIDAMNKAGLEAEWFILISDEGEMSNPKFVTEYQKYVKRTGKAPHVTLLTIGRDNRIKNELTRANIEFDSFEVGEVDTESVLNLLPIMNFQAKKYEILTEVLSTPLPAKNRRTRATRA